MNNLTEYFQSSSTLPTPLLWFIILILLLSARRAAYWKGREDSVDARIDDLITDCSSKDKMIASLNARIVSLTDDLVRASSGDGDTNYGLTGPPGQPGPCGPMGMMGPKGEKGEPCVCTCGD